MLELEAMVFNYKVRYKIWLTFILKVVPGEMLTFLDLKRFPCSDTALRDIHYSHYCKLTWSWLSTNIPHQRRGERVKSVTLAIFVCSRWLLLLFQDSNHKNPPIIISITVLYCTILYCTVTLDLIVKAAVSYNVISQTECSFSHGGQSRLSKDSLNIKCQEYIPCSAQWVIRWDWNTFLAVHSGWLGGPRIHFLQCTVGD